MDTNIVLTLEHVIGIIGVLGGFLFWAFNKLEKDITKMCDRLETQGRRTDRLYEMFIDIVKEKK